MRIGITGSRDINGSVGDKIRDALVRNEADEYVFGGAPGVDTIALNLVCNMCPVSKRMVIVPFSVKSIKDWEAREAIKACATDVIELNLDDEYIVDEKEPYRRRNEALVIGKTTFKTTVCPETNIIAHYGIDKLLAFWNGCARSGTYMTMNIAKKAGIPVEVINV